MWLFTVYGFYSISVRGNNVAVRARMKKHLEKLKERFPVLKDKPMVTLKDADYRYRIGMSRKLWIALAQEMMEEQTWCNFKDQATKVNGHDAYVQALHQIWGVMYDV